MRDKPRLILASSSRSRREVLDKMGFEYEAIPADIDETAKPNEAAGDLVKRLALQKAKHVADQHDHALVIGADQVGSVERTILGKSLTHERALSQLSLLSGKVCTFYTGLCLYDTLNQNYQLIVEPFEVHFRRLSLNEIEAYLKLEKPYHCAGSFKSESRGAMLCEKLMGKDPNTLIGLPVISLAKMLQVVGYPLFA